MKREELNLLTNLWMYTILRYMDKKYDSINFKRITKTIQKIVKTFESKLKELDNNKYCLSTKALLKHKLLKEKYYVFGAFLAAISSYPILYKVADEEDIFFSIFSKTSKMTGIKVLDNINDNFHNHEEAVKSQLSFQQALTQGYIRINYEEPLSWIRKAENSTYFMALWSYETVTSVCGKNNMFLIFIEDVDEYIDGQIRSFFQKNDKYPSSNMNLKEYIQKVTTKCPGKPWVDIDLCFYEKYLKKIPPNEMLSIKMITKSIDLLFRSLLFYDDVTDLNEDIKSNIVNSVVMLGLDLEKILIDDIFTSREYLPEKLNKLGIIKDAIHMGNIVYLNAVKQLLKAKIFTRYIDVDALIFNARVLRMFLLRKLLGTSKWFKGLSLLIQSLSPFEKLEKEIPSYLRHYEKLIIDLGKTGERTTIQPVNVFQR